MKKCLVIICMVLVLLISACGGGGGKASGNLNDENIPELISGLVPLNVSTTDLNNNPIPYIDVSLIGSHTQYKLKFTNPNAIAVTVPNPNLGYGKEMFAMHSLSDQNWLYSQAGVSNVSTAAKVVAAYYELTNPGMGRITDHFNKTGNPDDCFNTQSISPGGSCSFYAYAYNIGQSYAKENSIFTYPLAYLIKSLDGKHSLVVQQCTYSHVYGDDEVNYKCSNETKAGYANQFITYKMNAVNTGTTNLSINTFSGRGAPVISNDGNWIYSCQRQLESYGYNRIICNKYAMTYKDNFLTKASIPTTTVTMLEQIGQNNTIEQIYPSLDGSDAWVALYNWHDGYSLLYTKTPDVDYWDYCRDNTPCVPFIDKTQNVIGVPTGITGLDGSFWWNINGGADVYGPALGTFVLTNTGGALGVDATGVVITILQDPPGSGHYIGVCYKTKSGPTTYTKQEVLNYKYIGYGNKVRSMNKYVYLEMPLPGFVDALGKDMPEIKAYFKVHTENGLCEIQLDDYTMIGGETSTQYDLAAMSYGQTSGNFAVTPISNTYFGK